MRVVSHECRERYGYISAMGRERATCQVERRSSSVRDIDTAIELMAACIERANDGRSLVSKRQIVTARSRRWLDGLVKASRNPLDVRVRKDVRVGEALKRVAHVGDGVRTLEKGKRR